MMFTKIINYFLLYPAKIIIGKIKYQFLNCNKSYQLQNLTVYLPWESELGDYKNKIKTFNKYLFFLSKYIVHKNAYIIDIGANTGDTVIEMVTGNKKNTVIAIEGNNYYFKFLARNVHNLQKQNKSKLKIELIKNFIGNAKNKFGSIVKDGKGSGRFQKSKF
jgi:tRNA G46 methylase TrmB